MSRAGVWVGFVAVLLAGVAAVPVQAQEPITVVGGSVEPSVITAGDVAMVTIELSQPAPLDSNGVTVRIEPTNNLDRVAATFSSVSFAVQVPPGEQRLTFPYWARTLGMTEVRTIDLGASPYSQPLVSIAELTVEPADPATRAVIGYEGPTGFLEGTTAHPVAVLNTTAPADGLVVNHWRNTANGELQAAAHAFFPPGNDRVVHAVYAPDRNRTVPRLVTPYLSLGTSAARWETVIVPEHFSIFTGSVRRGDTVRRGLGIGDTPNPTGTTVHLSSDTPGVTVPPTLEIPAGSVGAPYDLAAAGWVTADSATITATWNGQTISSPVAITGSITEDPPDDLPPVATFTSSCTDLDCHFTDTSTDPDGTITVWAWDFGDGGTSTERHPTHAYDGSGTYTVTLTVTDALGATGETSAPVTVTAPPPPPVTTVHVAGLDGTSARSGRDWVARATIHIAAGDGTAVPGATVHGSWQPGGTARCVTDATGRCTVEHRLRSARTSWSITDVNHPTLSYEPHDNRTATTIELQRP